MKEPEHALGYLIESLQVGGLIKIARTTGKGQVAIFVQTAFTLWMDVLDLKGKIKDYLGCMAVFATVSCTASYDRVARIHLDLVLSCWLGLRSDSSDSKVDKSSQNLLSCKIAVR